MNVTPKTMAAQVRKVHTTQAERARIARVAPRTRLAFTSETGVVRPPAVEEVWEDFCFICGRSTDHSGEHITVVEHVEQNVSEFFDKKANVITRYYYTTVREMEGPMTKDQYDAIEEFDRFMASL